MVEQNRLSGGSEPKKPERKPLKVIGNVLFACFLLLVSLLVGLTLAGRRNGEINLWGYSAYIVQAGSMSPTIRQGALVIDKLPEAGQIKKGDIITFTALAENVTHRVRSVSVGDNGVHLYVTRGDANDADDPNPVSYANVRGVVRFHIPLLGSVLNYLRTPKFGLFLVVLPCLLIIVVELVKLVRFAKESKTRENP